MVSPSATKEGAIFFIFLLFLVLNCHGLEGDDILDDTEDVVDNISSSPWFGAKPTKKKYRLQRSGWEKACTSFCGGSERLGAVVDFKGDVKTLDSKGAAEIIDAVRAHGMIIIKHQNLTRSEQVEFTSRLGPVIVLPSSFEGKDIEPGQPAIQRITNFWANDTWKGPTGVFGNYWHQDGQFWLYPKNNILSIVHAQQVSACGRGQTGFADLRAARAKLSQPLVDLASNATIRASVRCIQDFKNGLEEDYAAFPESEHKILASHSLDDGPMLYIGSPHMWVNGVNSDSGNPTRAAGSVLLKLLFDHSTSPSFTYYHNWEPGDIVIWDNTQTLHQAMPYDNNGINRREMYRTQCRFVETEEDVYIFKPKAHKEAEEHTEL